MEVWGKGGVLDSINEKQATRTSRKVDGGEKWPQRNTGSDGCGRPAQVFVWDIKPPPQKKNRGSDKQRQSN